MVGIKLVTLEEVKTLGVPCPKEDLVLVIPGERPGAPGSSSVMEADGPFEAPSGKRLLGRRDGVVVSTSAELELFSVRPIVGVGAVDEFEGIDLVYNN